MHSLLKSLCTNLIGHLATDSRRPLEVAVRLPILFCVAGLVCVFSLRELFDYWAKLHYCRFRHSKISLLRSMPLSEIPLIPSNLSTTNIISTISTYFTNPLHQLSWAKHKHDSRWDQAVSHSCMHITPLHLQSQRDTNISRISTIPQQSPCLCFCCSVLDIFACTPSACWKQKKHSRSSSLHVQSARPGLFTI